VVHEISTPISLESLLTGAGDDLCLMFAERGGDSLEAVLKKTSTARQTITILVGSEGGWSNEEIERARSEGFHVVTLGGRILRAETAAITAAALVQRLFGDLK
jgi:16S rRNA (uracil1498-N3)-methyltransferase